MLILLGLATALAAGLARGGRLSRLGELRVAWWWVGLAAFAAQMVAVYGAGRSDDGLAIPLIVGSHVALVTVAVLNHHRPGARLLAAGLAMNLAVMLANGGLMPVAPETLAMAGRTEAWKIGAGAAGTRVAHSKDVVLARDDTRLELLADRYWTGLPGRLSILFSLGDVLLVAGIGRFVFATLTTAPGRPAREDDGDSGHLNPAPRGLAATAAFK